MKGVLMAQKSKQTATTVHADGLSAGDIAWVDARWRYFRGDVRPLAELVRNHDLSAEVRAFVADILRGAVQQTDGRKAQRQTDEVIASYKNMRRWNATLARHHGVESIIAEKDIWRMLDERFGYQSGTAKRTVRRYENREAGHKIK